jgi:hypothetical protein
MDTTTTSTHFARPFLRSFIRFSFFFVLLTTTTTSERTHPVVKARPHRVEKSEGVYVKSCAEQMPPIHLRAGTGGIELGSLWVRTAFVFALALPRSEEEQEGEEEQELMVLLGTRTCRIRNRRGALQCTTRRMGTSASRPTPTAPSRPSSSPPSTRRSRTPSSSSKVHHPRRAPYAHRYSY